MDCKEFSLSRFHEVTHALTLSKELKLSTVMAMFDEITLLFSTSSESEHNHVDCLGSALSFATSDVTTKLKHVRNRTNEMIEAGILTGPAENQSIEVCVHAPSFFLKKKSLRISMIEHYACRKEDELAFVWTW